MNTASIYIDDIVLVDKKGRRFHATVTDKKHGRLAIRPLCPGISYREATSREVRGHWRRSRKSTTIGGNDG